MPVNLLDIHRFRCNCRDGQLLFLQAVAPQMAMLHCKLLLWKMQDPAFVRLTIPQTHLQRVMLLDLAFVNKYIYTSIGLLLTTNLLISVLSAPIKILFMIFIKKNS